MCTGGLAPDAPGRPAARLRLPGSPARPAVAAALRCQRYQVACGLRLTGSRGVENAIWHVCAAQMAAQRSAFHAFL